MIFRRASNPVFVEDIGDQRRVAPLIAKYGISEIIHFAASVAVPESVAEPLRYYRNNTAKFPNPVRDRNQEWSAAFHLFIDGCGVRESVGKSCHGKDPRCARITLRLIQIHGRNNAA